jgi:hypothetical protein
VRIAIAATLGRQAITKFGKRLTAPISCDRRVPAPSHPHCLIGR